MSSKKNNVSKTQKKPFTIDFVRVEPTFLVAHSWASITKGSAFTLPLTFWTLQNMRP